MNFNPFAKGPKILGTIYIASQAGLSSHRAGRHPVSSLISRVGTATPSHGSQNRTGINGWQPRRATIAPSRAAPASNVYSPQNLPVSNLFELILDTSAIFSPDFTISILYNA